MINCLVVKIMQKFSRRDLDLLNEYVKIYKAKALSYLKYNDNELSGSIAKNLSEEEKNSLINELKLKENDLVLIVADSKRISQVALGALRIKLANELDIIDKTKYNCLWITEFPLYEYSEEEGKYTPAHHPFTSPRIEDMDKLMDDKENRYSRHMTCY